MPVAIKQRYQTAEALGHRLRIVASQAEGQTASIPLKLEELLFLSMAAERWIKMTGENISPDRRASHLKTVANLRTALALVSDDPRR